MTGASANLASYCGGACPVPELGGARRTFSLSIYPQEPGEIEPLNIPA